MVDEPGDIDELSIAVAHWHVRSWGGAEYLVIQLADALDLGTVYTLGEPTPDDSNPYGDIEFHDVTPHPARLFLGSKTPTTNRPGVRVCPVGGRRLARIRESGRPDHVRSDHASCDYS